MVGGLGTCACRRRAYAKPDTEVKPEQEEKKYTAEDK